MKKLIAALLFAVAQCSPAPVMADVKISQLPLGSAASTGSTDSFPYVNVGATATYRLELSDLINLPSMVATYAAINNPTFTGTVNIPALTLVGTSVLGQCWTATDTSGNGGWQNCSGGGGGGTPGGSSSDVQYNSSGSFAGNSSFTYDGAGNVTAGTFIGALTGHASLDLKASNNLSDVSSASTSLNNLLPSQTGNSGKVLQTNGSASSWQPQTGGISALTGDVTASGSGSVAATVAQIAGVSVGTPTGTGNVVFSNSPTLVTPALGTPSALVATNVTGTASGLTAGHVTTNANLTGAITSSGNATSIASQTGTGTRFVVDTSPTLVTPNIGAATGTSLSVSGQLTSTQTTGTAPFAVSSTTQVANLNSATAGTATNANNGATVATSSNLNYFPLFVQNSTNGNQPFNLGTGLTFNPSTNTLATTVVAATGAVSGSNLTSGGHASADLQASNNLSDVGTKATAFNNVSPLSTKGDTLAYSTTNVRQGAPPDYGLMVPDSAQSDGWRAANYTQTDGRPTKNYIQYADLENGSVSLGWSLGTIGTLSTGNLPIGTPTFGSGASGNLSTVLETSSPLAGAASLKLLSSAATTVGNMLASSAYAIDAEDAPAMLNVAFHYAAFTGGSLMNMSGTSSNSYAWAAWDATNSVWLSTTGNFCMNGSGLCQGTVQTGATTASIRFVLYNANATGTGTATLELDDFALGPFITSHGYAGQNWKTLTGVTYTGLGTVTPGPVTYARFGDTMRVHGHVTNGTATAVIGYIVLPSGYAIDTSKINTTARAQLLGTANAQTIATADLGAAGTVIGLSYDGTNPGELEISWRVSNGTYLNDTANSVFPTANTPVDYDFTIPIAGWDANTVQGSDAAVNAVAARYTDTSGTSYTAGTETPFVASTLDYDTNAAYSGTTFKTPVTGKYKACAATNGGNVAQTAGGANYFIVYKNGSGTGMPRFSINNLQASGTFRVGLSGCTEISAVSGDLLQMNVRFSSTGAVDTTAGVSWVSYELLSSPATINPVLGVAGGYHTATATITGTNSTAKFTVLDSDTNALYNVSTGVWTCGPTGHYSFQYHLSTGATCTASEYIDLTLQQAGSATTKYEHVEAGVPSAGFVDGEVAATMYCQQGDTVTPQINSTCTSVTIVGGVGRNFFTWARQGN